MLENINLPWNWGGLSENPNITIADILQNKVLPWDWYWMSNNEFIHNKILQKKLLEKYRKTRKNNCKNIFAVQKYIDPDSENIICEYIDYD